jgi:hypothetical protein
MKNAEDLREKFILLTNVASEAIIYAEKCTKKIQKSKLNAKIANAGADFAKRQALNAYNDYLLAVKAQ